MKTYTTINYSDLYAGPKPSIATLLEGINSKTVVIVLAMINAELYGESPAEETQARLTRYLTQSFPSSHQQHIWRVLDAYQRKTNGPVLLWGKRYVLAFLKYEFLHYRPGDDIATSGDQELRIFQAYLLIAEQENEKDRIELKRVREMLEPADPFFFEKLVWPFALKQFDTNNRVSPVSQFFKILALVKYSANRLLLVNAWRTFLLQNGFPSMREFLGSFYKLLEITQQRFSKPDLRVFSWLNADQVPRHLLNLSFDVKQFQADPKKQVDFLGLREKPLFRSDDHQFVILDHNFLISKTYSGTLFDVYYQTPLNASSAYPTFPDFKNQIGKEVSETIVFKSILFRLFQKAPGVTLLFDDTDVDGHPDCLIQWHGKILLIEFKDYLFPGQLVESYAFDKIKEHIDLKFVKNQKGKNKGITQIIAQIETLRSSGGSFSYISLPKKATIYPVIVHTNFMYQMPGINHYLQDQFQQRLPPAVGRNRVAIRPLTLIDQESLFEMLYLKDFTLQTFTDYLDRYPRILQNRAKRLAAHPNQDHFVQARASFDEIFHGIYLRESAQLPVAEQSTLVSNALEFDDNILDTF